jgi:undecaprenyl-diphosphatase
MEWLESLVLGLVQGFTEFLPISSDGHLLITQNLFAWLTGIHHSGEENLFFFVMLHVGTTVAILLYNRETIWKGAQGLLGSGAVPFEYQRPQIIRVGLLGALATTPLIPLALFFKDKIDKTFEGTSVAGYGFLVTAAMLVSTAWLSRREGIKGPAQMTWLDALLIGIAQMFAPFPGVSRSGLTIAMALALGLQRGWAVGFSLMIAVPAIMGATVFELRHVQAAQLTASRVSQTVAATVLAGIVGYFAIQWLFKVVKAGHIWYFSVYLVVLGLAVVSLS